VAVVHKWTGTICPTHVADQQSMAVFGIHLISVYTSRHVTTGPNVY